MSNIHEVYDLHTSHCPPIGKITYMIKPKKKDKSNDIINYTHNNKSNDKNIHYYFLIIKSLLFNK